MPCVHEGEKMLSNIPLDQAITNSHCQDPEAVPRDVMKRVVSTQQDSQLWIALHKLSSDL